jgi:hypothetical protein
LGRQCCELVNAMKNPSASRRLELMDQRRLLGRLLLAEVKQAAETNSYGHTKQQSVLSLLEQLEDVQTELNGKAS